MVGISRTAFVVSLLWVWSISAAQAYDYTHEVLPGETIAAVAARYSVTPKQIRRKNRLRRSYLRAGEKLKITTSVPCRPVFKGKYRIRRGDSLARVAKKFDMRVTLLRRLNPKLKKSGLRAGQTLWVVMEGPRPRGVNGLYQLTSGPGYIVRNPQRGWGTFLTVTRLMEVLANHGRAFPKATPIRIDDISRKGGGVLAPHRSHRRGRDVDIRFPLTQETDRYVAATPDTLDVDRTWDLVQRFLKTADVVYIFVDYRLQRKLYEHVEARRKLSKGKLAEFFQYPRSPHSMVGIIRHEPGHSTHMHVRFVKEQRPDPPNS